MTVSPNGTFKIAAHVDNSEGNGGLASYSIPLTGPILTIDNVATYGVVQPESGSVPDPIGFTLFRSTDNNVTQPLSGMQDRVNPNAVLLRGIGQTAGNAAAAPPRPVLAVEQGVWGVPFLLATATFTPSGIAHMGFNLQSLDLGAAVFTGQTGNSLTVATVTTGGFCIPEPATFALVGRAFAALAPLCRRRKVHAI